MYNRNCGFLPHFTSRFRVPDKIIISENSSDSIYRCLAESTSIYIQAKNGVNLYSCLNIAPGVKIVSANHDAKNLNNHIEENPISIGRNVWIGTNSIILPGVSIGDNVIIGAGSVVTKSIPDNSIAVGNPCKVIKENVYSYYNKFDCR